MTTKNRDADWNRRVSISYLDVAVPVRQIHPQAPAAPATSPVVLVLSPDFAVFSHAEDPC
jgi:hypothetical protein